MKKIMIALPLAAALAACGSNSSGDNAGSGGAKQQIKIVGSSTVYPFTTAVAEQFQRDNPKVSIVVESTGTGAGMKLFCAGVGANFPDIGTHRARSRRANIDCVANGAKTIIEVPIGIDGLTIIEGKDGSRAQPDRSRYLQGARRQSVRQGPEHGADLEGRQSGASGHQDPCSRTAADIGYP